MKKQNGKRWNTHHQRRLDALRKYRSIRSKKHGTVNLGDAIEWLSRLDGRGARSIDTDSDRLRNAVDDLKGALFAGALGGDAAHPIMMVADDQDLSHFTEKDISEAKRRPHDDPSKANMYDEIGPATELLNRLWVSRQLLMRLFHTRLWPMPDWLAAEAEIGERKKLSTKGNKERGIQKVIHDKFPAGIPNHMTAKERNEIILRALEEKGVRPLPVIRTIERAISKMTRT